MASIIGMRFCVNTMSKNHTIMFSLRVMTNYRHFLMSKEICINQQRCLQTLYHWNFLKHLQYICAKDDNRRHFSMTYVLAKAKDRGKDKKKQKTKRIDFNEMEQVIDVNKLTSQFDRAIEGLKDNFVKYLSVRSSIGALEELKVKFEGKDYTLQELAQISRKPKLVVLDISTFPQAIPNVLKSLSKNQMNLNPQQDGTTIYVPIPKVTREYRETLSKNAKSFYTNCCDNIRDIRNKQIKVLKQQEGLAKDLVFRMEDYVDILSQQYKSKAEQLLESKEKELLGESE
ncbi:ribosome-recycling factor, mitochondrial [Odontomachus brunneus]|uniref:ribosome-recycling factor, mitochondrial n=1 Tax=Odontomachus brunneus TaxID=486640 RepID=UPI0013F242CE|nr:ribosome-recycling factor, mitochondrial [Odontomachus brunneus]